MRRRPASASPSRKLARAVSMKTPITEICFIVTHFLVPFHDRKYQTKAPSPCSQISALSPAGRGNPEPGCAELSTAAFQAHPAPGRHEVEKRP